MPIFGPLTINLPITGSDTTSSGINFMYAHGGNGNYLNPGVTGSVASIKVNITEATPAGSSGELLFVVPSKENNGGEGIPVFTLSATGSTNEPRVGIGFTGSEKPIKAFDIKSVADTPVGTELLIRSARPTRGADIGDTAGTINFAIDTGSFIDISTTGSVGKIKGIVSNEDTSGIEGKIVFELFKGGISGRDVVSYGYNINDNQAANFDYIYTGSMELKDSATNFSHVGKASFEMRDVNNNLEFQSKAGNVFADGSGSFGGNISISASDGELVWSTQPTTPSIGTVYKQFNNGTSLLFETSGSFSATYTVFTGSLGSRTGILVGNIVGGTSSQTASLVSFSDTNTTEVGPLNLEFSASDNALTGSSRRLQIYGITTNSNLTLSGIIQNV
jgi:hypothetical protein